MKIITEKKYVTFLVYLCAAIYFVSYMTRINYAAVSVEMIESLKITQRKAVVMKILILFFILPPRYFKS